MRVSPPAPARPAAPAADDGALVTDSRRWAGYVATGDKFRQVTAEFSIPSVNCARTPGTAAGGDVAAFWAGIGGYTYPPFGQDGVDASCANGKAKYFFWYETPLLTNSSAGATVEPKFPVSAGQSVTVTVTYTASSRTFEFRVTDNTTGRESPLYKAARIPGTQSPDSSAEVITEAAQWDGKATPLPYFALAVYEGVSVTDQSGHASGLTSPHWSTTEYVETNGAKKLDVPGPLWSGTALMTTWEASS
jgi:hypothetical protein